MQLLTLLREYFGLLCCKITYSLQYFLILLITILLIPVLTPLMLCTFLQVSVGNYNYVIFSNTFNYKGIKSLFTGHIIKCQQKHLEIMWITYSFKDNATTDLFTRL